MCVLPLITVLFLRDFAQGWFADLPTCVPFFHIKSLVKII